MNIIINILIINLKFMPKKRKATKTKSKGKSLSRTTSGVLVETTFRATGKGGRKGKLLKKSTTRINAREMR